jgi:hypothetical protein
MLAWNPTTDPESQNRTLESFPNCIHRGWELLDDGMMADKDAG